MKIFRWLGQAWDCVVFFIGDLFFGHLPATAPVETPLPSAAKPVEDPVVLETHYTLGPLEEGDVVRTSIGPVSVLGVDNEGTAWCLPMVRTNLGYEFSELLCLNARDDAQHRVVGVKHSFGEIPS